MVQRGTRTASKSRQVTPNKENSEEKEGKYQHNNQMGISRFF